MDLGVLLAALTQADAGSREVNPFAPLQDASQGIGNILLQNAQNFSPTENAWGGLAAGLLSGVTGNLVNNFQDKQNQTAQDLIFKIAAGQDVGERPSNISPSVFSKLENTTNILKLQEGLDAQKEKRQAELATQEAINRAKAIAPIELENDLAKQKALLELQRTSGYGGLPSSLQDDYLKQQATAQQAAKATTAIDDYFEKAKSINSLAAAVPGTTAANDIQGIQVGLTNMLQSLQGREMNDSARKALQATLPDWNDSEKQIDQKKELFKQMMGAIQPSTPLVGQATTPGRTATPIPEGAVDTGRTAGGKKVYNVGGKLWVPD